MHAQQIEQMDGYGCCVAKETQNVSVWEDTSHTFIGEMSPPSAFSLPSSLFVVANSLFSCPFCCIFTQQMQGDQPSSIVIFWKTKANNINCSALLNCVRSTFNSMKHMKRCNVWISDPNLNSSSIRVAAWSWTDLNFCSKQFSRWDPL